MTYAACLSACGGSAATSTSGITTRVGEVHMHQYASGGHVDALFVDPPTPIGETSFDAASPNTIPATLDSNGCQLYLAMNGCSGTACPVSKEVDGGRVEVSGLPTPVELTYQPQFGSYTSYSTTADFLKGGVTARISGGGVGTVAAFAGEVEMPQVITPTTTLDNGIGAGLEISWAPVGDDSQVKVLLNVVPSTGYGASIVCFISENAARIRLPDAMMAHLPPAPRQLQLEVSRYRLKNVAMEGGTSVVLHGGYAVLSARAE